MVGGLDGWKVGQLSGWTVGWLDYDCFHFLLFRFFFLLLPFISIALPFIAFHIKIPKKEKYKKTKINQ